MGVRKMGRRTWMMGLGRELYTIAPYLNGTDVFTVCQRRWYHHMGGSFPVRWHDQRLAIPLVLAYLWYTRVDGTTACEGLNR
jgi:hypothetical protein